MRKFSNVLAALALVTATAAPALADSKQPAPPQVPEQAARLQRLVGTWKGTATITMGKDVVKATARMQCERAAGGLGIRCTDRFDIPGMGVYEESDIMGYDPGDRLVHWFSVTSMGETHDHKGSWDGDTLVLQHTGPSPDGKLYSERIAMTVSGKSIKGTSVCTVGNAVDSTFEFSLSK